jgi:hypothetical protein
MPLSKWFCRYPIDQLENYFPAFKIFGQLFSQTDGLGFSFGLVNHIPDWALRLIYDKLSVCQISSDCNHGRIVSTEFKVGIKI